MCRLTQAGWIILVITEEGEYLITYLWSAASQSVGHFLATCILAARAPYMELSSLVIALCDHQQKLRQQFQLITNTTLLFD